MSIGSGTKGKRELTSSAWFLAAFSAASFSAIFLAFSALRRSFSSAF